MTVDKELIERYIAGNCTRQESEIVERFLNGEQEPLPTEKQEWNMLAPANLSDTQSDKLLAGIKKQIIPRGKTFRLKYAVLATLVMVCLYFGYEVSRSYRPETLEVIIANKKPEPRKARARRSAKHIIQWLSLANYSQEIEKMVLPDGSKVALDPSSELRYTSNFANGKRHVYLSGTAHFDVIENKKNPFIVFTGNVSTQAIGTAFTIIAKKATDSVEIIMHKGITEIKFHETQMSTLHKPEKLFAGETLSISTKSGILEKTSENNERQWRLRFYQTPLELVLKSMERRFGVKIELKLSDKRLMRFTGTQESTDMLKDLLIDLAIVNNLHYKQLGAEHWMLFDDENL